MKGIAPQLAKQEIDSGDATRSACLRSLGSMRHIDFGSILLPFLRSQTTVPATKKTAAPSYEGGC